jgi:large subunit ribosomal protein L15
MGAGLPDYVVVNLGDLASFAAGETVSLDTLSQRGQLNLSGRESRLPLKVLGTGELGQAVTIRAAKFSASARAKIEAAGGTAVELAAKPKWTRKRHEAAVRAAAKAAGVAPKLKGKGGKK